MVLAPSRAEFTVVVQRRVPGARELAFPQERPATREQAIRSATQRRKLRTLPRLSVVIVNYFRWEHTAALVKQLLASRTMRRRRGEIVIVDNHSPAHPLTRRLRRCPGVSLRRWGRNRGFARAVNEGCRLGEGDWILLLNPDMTLTDQFVDRVARLVDELVRDKPRVGIVGLGLRDADGKRQASTGTFPTFFSTLARLLLPRSRRKYHLRASNEPCQVDWVTGCGMLIRRDCLEQLGGFDANFFLYYEDVDLCRRARSAGWEVWHVPGIDAVHHHPLHRRSVTPALRVVTRHSLLVYASKHWKRWQFRLMRAIVRAEAWGRRFWSRRRGDGDAANLFAGLGSLAACFAPRGRETDPFLRRVTDRRCFYD